MKTIIGAALAAIVVAACGGDTDVSPETLTKALVEQGLDEPIAQCISSDLSSQLTEEQFSDVALAETESDIPADLQDLVFEVTADCVLADG